MTATNLDNWLSLVEEDVIDPQLPIIDPHHHLWEHPDYRYVAEDFLRDVASGHNVVQTVFVECMSMYRASGPDAFRPVGETEYVCQLAEGSDAASASRTKVAAGIVGYADLTLGDAVEPVLQAHIESGKGRFRGIRHASGWDASDDIRNSHTHPSAGLLSDEGFRAGFAQLAKKQLSFDAWLYHPQIPELTELAHAFPETTIIIDHIGGPLGIGPYSGQRESVLDQWKRNMAKLADCDNVCVKLGGLAMKICGFDWHRRDIPPTSDQLARANGDYYQFCIEHFGIQRCMFESNFPVDKLSCSYGVLWNAFKKIAGKYSAQERTALFHDNAARIYRLQPDV